jgi:sulfite reductase (NADPH) hemoprotein beta-component
VKHILTYLDAILRVYNLHGRRDNKYKARIKILVKAMGAKALAAKVEEEWSRLKDGPATLTEAEIDRAKSFFTEPDYELVDAEAINDRIADLRLQTPAFNRWLDRNVSAHKTAGYSSVTLSLKKTGIPPGDITSEQMEAVADLADQYSFGEIRTTHEQNLVLADVRNDQLFEIWQQLVSLDFASPTVGTLHDVICCPGGDFCSLANAKSIPVAEVLQRKFEDLDYLYDLGDLDLNISGCMNACGHHHVGHIGIIGVDKKGEEWYQVQLGGNAGIDTSLGTVLGPSFARDDLPEVIDKLLNVYIENRIDGESFLETYRRIEIAPFKEAVYAS